METPPIRFEHGAVILCQCVIPCRLPFRAADGLWQGCWLEAGHDGDHSENGSGIVHYRTETQHTGPRVVLRPASGDVLAGECPRCHATYTLSMTATALSDDERAALPVSALISGASSMASHGPLPAKDGGR